MVLVRREGDWDCTRCGNIVFARHSECPMCNGGKRWPRPHNKRAADSTLRHTGPRDSTPRHTGQRRKGDWNCPSCGVLNFTSRTECFKCKEPRPAEDGEAEAEEEEPELQEPHAAEDQLPFEDELPEEPLEEEPDLQEEVEVEELAEEAAWDEEDELAKQPTAEEAAEEEPDEDGAQEQGRWKRRRRIRGERTPPWALGPERQPNDWDCTKCGALNFARRDACFRCNAPRYAPEPPPPSTKSVERKPGDWDCPQCNALNFARRDRCFKCGHHREASDQDQAPDIRPEVDGSMAPKSPPMRPASPPGPPGPPSGEALKALLKLSPKFRRAWLDHCRRMGRNGGDPSKCERRFLVEFLDHAGGLVLAADTAKPVVPRPSSKPSGTTAPKTLSIKRTVVERIAELNESGKLLQDIRLPSVAVYISRLSEQEALEVLEHLEDVAHEVEDPTDFVRQAADDLKSEPPKDL